MKRGWLALMVALMLTYSAMAHAQVDESTAERLMRSSGLWEQVAQLGPQMRVGLEQAGRAQGMGGPQAEGLRRLSEAAEDAFSPVAVRVLARREMAQRLDAKHVPALSAWFDSELGRRITALEVAASAEVGTGDTKAAAGAQRLQQGGARRRELIAALSQAMRNAETGARLVLNMSLGLQIGMARASGQADVPPADELRARAQPQLGALQQQLEPLMQAMLAETYAPLADADLEAYLRLAQTSAGRHLSDVVIETFDRVALECSEEMARRGARV